MKKKGFTLVELLAVIAILAILVIIALPNVIKLYNDAKKNSFLTETKTVYKEATNKYISENMKGNKVSYINSENNTKLEMTGNKLKYCVLLNSDGSVNSLVTSNNNYYIEYDGKSDINKYTKDDIKEVNDNIRMICSSTIAKVIKEPSIKQGTYGGTLENDTKYNDGLYTYTYHPWNGGFWNVTLTDKESTDEINTSFYNIIDGKYVKNATGLFKNSQAKVIDVSDFNTSYITNMSYMFGNAATTEIKGLEYLNTSGVTDMDSMFGGTFKNNNDTQKAILDLSGFDTKNVKHMQNMFNGSQASSIVVSNFDTSKVTEMYGMFMSTQNIRNLDLSSFNTKNVTNMSGMFRSCGVESLDLSNFNTSNVTNMSAMFQQASKQTSNIKLLNLSGFDTSNVTNMLGMFSVCTATEIKGLENFNTSNVTNMYAMFSDTVVNKLDLSNFNTENVTNMQLMFRGSAAKKIIFSDKFNTGNVTNMRSMFAGTSAEKLDLSSFDTSNVTNMYWMFFGAKVKELDLTSFNTSKVTNMGGMFRATNIDPLDISSFDITLADISYMFDGVPSAKVYVKNETDLEKYKSSGSVTNNIKFYVKTN